MGILALLFWTGWLLWKGFKAWRGFRAKYPQPNVLLVARGVMAAAVLAAFVVAVALKDTLGLSMQVLADPAPPRGSYSFQHYDWRTKPLPVLSPRGDQLMLLTRSE